MELAEGEQARYLRKQTNNVAAYEDFLRGLQHYRRFTPEDNDKALAFFEKAAAADPSFLHAQAEIGWAEFNDINLRGRADLMGVSFLGGTDLLRVLVNGLPERLGRDIMFSSCGFRAADVPAGLEAAKLGIVPLIEGKPRGAEG